MIQKKFIVLFAVFSLILLPLLSTFSIKANNLTYNSKFDLYQAPDSYLIEGVPYVSQETNFYCGFATPTMILKYFGINTTLEEVVYNSGVGYSLMYPSLKNNKLPYCGWITSQEVVSCEFISDLYGLSFSFWKTPFNSTFEDIWEDYWFTIKQQISNDLPIAVVVDESTLIIDNLGLKIIGELTNFLPIVCNHFTLIVGYNETNQSVCYNDPFCGVIQRPEIGTYRWVSLDKFKISSKKVANILFIKIFNQSINETISKQDAFNLSHKRNIQKLMGNFSVFFDEYSGIYEEDNYSLGINATKELKKQLNNGFLNKIKTAYRYKLNNNFGIFYRTIERLYKNHQEVKFDLNKLILEPNDVFENLVWEKKYTADYLEEIKDNLTDENLIRICEYESVLFKNEAENWSMIENYYNEFRKMGIFLSLPYALSLLEKMVNVLDKIIFLEEAIINGPINE